MFNLIEKNKLVIQIILGLVALTFVGFGIGNYATNHGGEPFLAKVGSQTIYQRDVDRELPNQAITPEAKERALMKLIEQKLLLEEASQQGLSVSDKQIIQAIAKIPELQKNGQFSSELYRTFLANQGLSAQSFQEKMRSNLILQNELSGWETGEIVPSTLANRIYHVLYNQREVQRWQIQPADLAAKVNTDDATLKRYYDGHKTTYREPERVKLDYVILSQESLAQSLKISDQEIQQYYNQHKAEYNRQERRAAHILLAFPPNATEAQKKQVKVQAEQLLNLIRTNPARFSALAREKSQDPGSASRGGDLGFLAPGTTVPPFNKALFSLKVGQISDVVETQFGYHIIRLDEIRSQGLDQLKPEIEHQIQIQKANTMFRAQLEKLSDLTYQQSTTLKPVEAALGLTIQHSDWVKRNQSSADPLWSNPKVQAAIFGDDVLKNKNNSEPIDLGDNRYMVLRVVAHEAERQKAFDEVKAEVKQAVILQEGAKLAQKQGESLLAELKTGKSVSPIAWSPSQAIMQAEDSGLPAQDKRAIFAVPIKTLPAFAGIKQQDGSYAVYKINKTIPAKPITTTESDELQKMLAQILSDAEINSYLEMLQKKYPVQMVEQKPTENS